MENTRVRGVVQWFNDAKGYGFILAGDGTQVFSHYSDILPNGPGRRYLQQHQEVEFELDHNAKGPRARKISPVGA